MTVFDRLILRFFLYPELLFRRFNVNTVQLKDILTAKLTMDNRRPSSFELMRQSNKTVFNDSTLKTMFSSLVLGVLLMISLIMGSDLLTKLTVSFSMFIFLLAAIMISDFTSVLIDIKDTLIILPKPVNHETFLTSRMLHIAIHLTKVLLPLLLPSIIFLAVSQGALTTVTFVLMTMVATFFVIFLINIFYILVLNITKPEKFQSVISYFQIGLAILIYGSFQLIPRLSSTIISDVHVSGVKFIQFFPPFWFADVTAGISSNFGKMQFLNLFLALGVTGTSLFMIIKFLAPEFTRKLSLINSTAVEVKNTTGRRLVGKKSIIDFLALKATINSAEYSGFLFAWKMMSRSREFKLKVYPFIGYLIVLSIIIVAGKDLKDISLEDFITLSSKGKMILLFLIYLPCILVFSAITQIPYSSGHKASWIFRISPLPFPGHVITGALKSVMVQFLVPVIVPVIFAAVILTGPVLIPNLTCAVINSILMCSVMAAIKLKSIPFSEPYENQDKGLYLITNLFMLIFPLTIGFIHRLIFDSYTGLLIDAAAGIVITGIIFRRISRKTV